MHNIVGSLPLAKNALHSPTSIILEIRIRSRVPRAANVYVLRTVKLGLASPSQRLCNRYVQVESWANRLHAARIGSYSGWPPLRCVRTASPMSRTIVVRGGLRLPADCNGRRSNDISKRYTGARDTTFARVAQEIIGFLSVTDTYIHTYNLFPRGDAELVASR